MKSTYQYDDLDRVKAITHTNAMGQVLASVSYERNGIGEPTKITREDSTFTRLEYDEALRVKQESFFSSAGTLVEETSYTYDAAGKRTATTTTVGTQTTSDTYNYTAGYQLDSVTGTTGADDYQFDANGRLTLINRDGKTLDLNHDVQDRLTSVENETTGSTISYTYDAQGRRVAATEGAEVRQFLVAPAMGGGLESTDLIADGNGNLISNYVYAGGASPFMMLDAQGNPVYYLSDGMGSVIGLANGSGNEVGDFRYDSFGNVREEWGGAIGSTGGDFRFQGQWLEEGSSLYHFRARDYDAQTGTFLSRDPVDPTEQQPEAMNPYQFAYNNPQVYSDPSGMITITELQGARIGQEIVQNIRTYAVQEAKEYLAGKARQYAANALFGALGMFLPFDSGISDAYGTVQAALNQDEALGGVIFEIMLKQAFCSLLPEAYQKYIFFEPEIYTGSGNAKNSGYQCPQVTSTNVSRNTSRPDFIATGGRPRRNSGDGQRSLLVGDIKISLKTVVQSYFGWQGAGPTRNGPTQWNTINKYAEKHGAYAAGFITLFDGGSAQAALRNKLVAEGIEKGTIIFVASAR